MFKSAPRYLSGISVFYGDDITRREIDGEVVFILGQAERGPKVPLALKNIDIAPPVYGANNPLTKALYQFWDGYIDSPMTQTLKVITLRVGGIAARIQDTTKGIDFETIEAYDGIESDYYFYAVKAALQSNNNLKIWNKNKQLVYDFKENINSGYIQINIPPTSFIGSGTWTVGVDIDNNPAETATSMESYKTVTNPAVATVILTVGDSQLNLPVRTKYELFRNALSEIEQYTPDYIVPGGVIFDEVDEYVVLRSRLTNLTAAKAIDSATITIDAAADWPTAGTIYFDHTVSGITWTDSLTYTDLQASGNDYSLTIPTFNYPTYKAKLANPSYPNDETVPTKLRVEQGDQGFGFEHLLNEGAIKIGTGTYHYIDVDDQTTFAVLTLHNSTQLTDNIADDTVVQRVSSVVNSNFTSYEITTSFNETVPRQLGIGYVKETDSNGIYTFDWSDVNNTAGTKDYGLAHFGYLFANFCNKAAIDYNTPLCGMNTSLPTSYDRFGLYGWIGKYPTYNIVTGVIDPASISAPIQSVVGQGLGLLGNPVLAGSPTYNRSNLSDINGGVYADPAYGLLLTSNDYIDGYVEMDTFSKVVDLGKFMLVGAGLLTFNHKGANYSYIDTCGIYSLGLLAGKPKNEGLSFSKIGQRSQTSVGVIVHRRYYNDLANLGYIVLTREKGLGWVINNGNSVARNDSGYYLISTTRTVKTIVEGKRALLTSFINKPLNDYYYEAAKTKLAESFKKDVQDGYINGYSFDLQAEETPGMAIGKLYLKIAINPPFEITQIVIDTVIDRSITSV